MFESDADRLAMLRALGAGDVSSPRGTFTGLLELDFVQVGDVPVDSVAPRLAARTSDVAALGISEGVALGYDGASYVVRSVQPDGSGMTTLLLEGP